MADELDKLTSSIDKLNLLLKKMVDVTTKQTDLAAAKAKDVSKLDPVTSFLEGKFRTAFKEAGDKLEDAAKKITKGAVAVALVSGGVKLPRRAGQAAAGGLGGAAKGISSPIDVASKVLGPLNSAIGGIAGSIMGAFGPIVSLVSHINPALVQQFEMAFDDLQAVLGDALQPVLKVGIELIRKYADVLETMRPAIDPLIQVIVDLIGQFAELFTPLAEIYVPVLGVMTSVLKGLQPVLAAVITGLKYLASTFTTMINGMITAVNWAIKQINKLLPKGWELGEVKKLNFADLTSRSAFGKSIRDVSYKSGEDIGAETRKAAFAQTVNWQEQTATNTKEVAKLLVDLIDVIKEMEGDTSSYDRGIEDMKNAIIGWGVT